MVNINGKMDKFTKVNGKMDWKMDLEYGEDQKEILILGSGEMERQTGTEYIPG